MLLTTSRRTPPATKLFCKDMEGVLPFSFYTPRGAKTLRTLLDTAYEKGMDRLCVVENKGEIPHRLAFINVDLDWQWMGHMDVTVRLGRTAPSIEEDVDLCVKGKGKYRDDIIHFFNASTEESYSVLHLKENTITFYRKDLYTTPVGPQMTIEDLCRYDVNETNDDV